MQLLMRRRGRIEKRQMYYDAHSAFNEGLGEATVEDTKGRQGILNRGRKTERTHRPHQRWCTS